MHIVWFVSFLHALMSISLNMNDKNERQPLVAVLKTTNTNSFNSKFRIIIVLNISLLSYFGIYYAVYPRNEWLQNKIQRETFPNQTVSVNKVCGEINQSDPNYDKHDTVQKITAKWNMYATMVNKGATVLTAFVYTAYTDCYGRRFLFILSAMSLFIQSGSIATIIYFDAHPVYLVIAESIYGLTGSSYGFLAAMYAYMADLTAAGKERSTALFLSSASTYMGGAIGTFSVGFYIQRYGYFYPALTAASFQLALLLLSIFIIPESHSAERRIASPPFFSVIKRPFVFYASADFKRVRCGFLLLLIAFAFVDMTITHRKTLETLYQLALPFCWKPTQIALFATAVSVGENIFGLGSMKLLQRCVKDINIALISAVTNAGSLVVEGLAKTSLTMFLGKSVYSLLISKQETFSSISLTAMQTKIFIQFMKKYYFCI